MEVITICGSYKKAKLMNLLAKRIMSNIEDTIVFTPSMYNYILGIDTNDMKILEVKNTHKKHDFLINRSDYVLIIDYDAGSDTYRELEYAESMNKTIIRFSEIIQYFKKDEEIMKEIIE